MPVLGASFISADFLIHGNLYTGQNMRQQCGNLTEFSDKNSNLSSGGFRLQAGYNFTWEIN